MFGNRWRLFRLFGIPISVDPSWLIVLALLTWTMAQIFHQPYAPLSELYPEGGLGLEPGGYLAMGLVAALAFFVCLVLHEMGHALVARRSGMPIRGITLFLFGGVAELEGEPPSAGREFAMAIAGPLVSLVLALVFGGLAWGGHALGWHPVLVVLFGYMASINFTVLLFNMVPAFPLDGGRVLRSALWAWTGRLRKATRWASMFGQAFAWLLIFWGVLQFFDGNVFGGVWLGLIGMFLNNAAQGSYRQIVVRQLLEGEPVRRFMNAQPIVVTRDVTLRSLVEDYIYRYHHKAFPVAGDGRIEGYISSQVLTEYPRDEWDDHYVGEVMDRDLEALTIAPDADAMHALARMQRTGHSRLLVVDGDRLVGLLSLKDLLRFLELKLQIEGEDSRDEEPPSGPRGFLRRPPTPTDSSTSTNA